MKNKTRKRLMVLAWITISVSCAIMAIYMLIDGRTKEAWELIVSALKIITGIGLVNK
ncbi:MAG: hypothetical protein ACK5MU_04055 [Candidatus Saccharimonadales bacterium]